MQQAQENLTQVAGLQAALELTAVVVGAGVVSKVVSCVGSGVVVVGSGVVVVGSGVVEGGQGSPLHLLCWP